MLAGAGAGAPLHDEPAIDLEAAVAAFCAWLGVRSGLGIVTFGVCAGIPPELRQ